MMTGKIELRIDTEVGADAPSIQQVAEAIAYIDFLFRAKCLEEIGNLTCDIGYSEMVLYTADSSGFTETFLWDADNVWTPEGADNAPNLHWISTEGQP